MPLLLYGATKSLSLLTLKKKVCIDIGMDIGSNIILLTVAYVLSSKQN
jgi:hypothetical protein